MNNKLKIGLIGGGWIFEWHLPGFEAMKEYCEIVALAEINPGRFPIVASMINNPDLRCYADWKEMLAKEKLDVVDIILPHHLHLQAVLDAANTGVKFILLEKIMARNSWECQQMNNVCEKSGSTLVVCCDRRHAGHWAALKKIVDSGKLGKVNFYRMESNGHIPVGNDGWIRNIDYIGGGAMMSCLSHQFDALRWLEGEAESVISMTQTLPNHMPGDITSVATIKMKSGAMALLNINWNNQATNDRMPNRQDLVPYEYVEVTGEEGVAYYRYGAGTFFKAKDSDAFVPLDNPLETTSHGHLELIREFIKLCLGKPNDISSFGTDTIKTVELAEAAYIADAQGKRVSLPLPRVKWEDRLYMKK